MQAVLTRPWILVLLAVIGAGYVYVAFVFPHPGVRILLRTAPVLPFAIWAIFFDPRRPFRTAPPGRRLIGQTVLLVATLVFAVLVLGLGLNWVFDPRRIA